MQQNIKPFTLHLEPTAVIVDAYVAFDDLLVETAIIVAVVRYKEVVAGYPRIYFENSCSY